MIITTTRHGRTSKDVRYLLAHLSKQDGQRSRVVSVAAPVDTASEALDYMQALRDGSRATVACHHLSLSPGQPMTDRQRDEAVARVLAAMEVEDHAYVVWEHGGKDRRGRDVDTHYHIVVAHVGPDGRALDDGRSYVRLEAAARSLEFDFGHGVTPSRHADAVASELERIGRPNVAAQVRGEVPPEPPASAMSSRQRARSARHGIDLADVRDVVRRAWKASDGPAALRAALAEHGLDIAPGHKPGVWIVTGPDGVTLGALDRLSGERRRAVAKRMQQGDSHDSTDTAAARHARPESDLRRSPRRPRGGRGAGPAAGLAGASGSGRGGSARGSDGPSDRHLEEPGVHARRDRGIDGAHRRHVQENLTLSVLVRAARDHRIRHALWRTRRRQHSRLHHLQDARRLVRLDLDELRRLAEKIGRRLAGLLIGTAEPPRETRAEALVRLRDYYQAGGKRHRSSASVTAPDVDPVPAYRPHF
ncbi:hypothetical protein FJ546_10035 [Mesorhizobium sp. B2-4-19]|nr:hypothetical protein FJ546_10035 [Mesorhizobium sp. B2-4-19]